MNKSQIDRLGDRLRKGQISDDDLRLLDDYRRSFIRAYEVVFGRIEGELNLRPTGRPAKSSTALVEKLLRETARLSQIQDIAGCRLVFPAVGEQEAVVARLQELFPGSAAIDRRNQPSHGYRAVHVIVRVGNKLIEVQVRTELQHRWAELSEKYADTIDPGIKYGRGNEAILTLLAGWSNAIARFERLELESIDSGTGGILARMSRQQQIQDLRRELATFLEQSIADLDKLR